MGISLSRHAISADKELIEYVNSRGWTISEDFLMFTGIKVKNRTELIRDVEQFEKKYVDILRCIRELKRKLKAKKSLT